MKYRLLTLCVGAAIAALVAAPAFGAKKCAPPKAPAEGAEVSFCGTVVQLVESGCIGVQDSKACGPLYEISGIGPKPSVGSTISGAGYTGGISTCQQGISLATAMWKKVDFCTLAKKK